MRFLIYAPSIYDPRGGGCIALHKLAHNIATVHGECFIYTDSVNPDYKGIMVDKKEAMVLASLNEVMTVYPEVTIGNPLFAKHITRWILYHVRFLLNNYYIKLYISFALMAAINCSLSKFN